MSISPCPPAERVTACPAATVVPHIGGLDTLRAAAAVWVMLAHELVPPISVGYERASFLPRAWNAFYTGSVSGPAAVILFFIISGLCIHHPYHAGKPFLLGEFLLRRFVRISLPMAGALALCRLTGFVPAGDPDWLAGVPAWSLVAELIYYALYPMLRPLGARVGWTTLFWVTFAVAFVLSLTQPASQVDYPAWGRSIDWLMGLPCWLLGVRLAAGETPALLSFARAVTKREMLRWRAGAIALGAILQNLALQRVLGHHRTLNFFALFAGAWLGREIAWRRVQPAPPLLEWAGTWSYSLYLVHPLAHDLWKRLHLPSFGYLTDWVITAAFILLVAIAFHFVVERPSHQIARRLARAVKG